jgi:hypothetical protein
LIGCGVGLFKILKYIILTFLAFCGHTSRGWRGILIGRFFLLRENRLTAAVVMDAAVDHLREIIEVFLLFQQIIQG